MPERSAYRLDEVRYRGHRTIVYAATRRRDSRRVIIKSLTGERPTPEGIAQIKREHRLLSRLAGCGVPEAALDGHASDPLLVMDDFGARSLAELMTQGRLPLDQVLSIGVQSARALAAIHSHVIHRDISPGNIVFEPQSQRLAIIDFGLSTDLSAAPDPLAPMDRLAVTLPYLAPEQTGRMDRAIDARCDLYALGASLFHLLAARPPFQSDDPLELVHAHLALRPPHLHQLTSSVPEAVSQLIDRLLAKMPEERYPDAASLADDLQRYLDAVKSGGLADYPLASRERPPRFRLPDRLVLRDREQTVLLRALRQSAGGAFRLVFIDGELGSGRASLVDALANRAAADGASVARGAFGSVAGDSPYCAWRQALSSFVASLLALPESELEGWRLRLRAALGQDAALVASEIADLNHVLMMRRERPQSRGLDDGQRFQAAMLRLIKACASAARPLLIVLDNLQWADPASNDLLRAAAAAAISHLLVIAIHQQSSDEPQALRQGWQTLLRDSSEAVIALSLLPLGLHAVAEFVGDALRRGGDEDRSVGELTELVYNKTGGNSLLLVRLLNVLHNAGAFSWNAEAGYWDWDWQHVRAASIPESPKALLRQRLKRLPEPTQQWLAAAACLGGSFSGELLQRVVTGAVDLSAGPQNWQAQLEAALYDGLLVSPALTGSPRHPRGLGTATATSQYRFENEHVRQCAQELLADDQRIAIHYRAGHALLAAEPTPDDEQLFSIVGHWLRAERLLKPAEIRQLASLSRRAGDRARHAGAYQDSCNHYRRGIRMLAPDGWHATPRLMAALHLGGAAAAYSAADFRLALQWAEQVAERPVTREERILSYEVRIASASTLRHPRSFDLAFEALRLLGVDLPKRPSKLRLAAEFGHTKLLLRGVELAELVERPAMRDPEQCAIMRILAIVTRDALLLSPELASLIVMKQLQLSLRHGMSPNSGAALAGFKLLVAVALGDTADMEHYALVAERLVERFGSPLFVARMRFQAWTLRSFTRPLRVVLKEYRKATPLLHAMGDQHVAVLATGASGMLALCCRLPLSEAERMVRADHESIARQSQQALAGGRPLPAQFWQLMLCLQGRCEEPARLSGDAYDLPAMLSLHRRHGDREAEAITYVLQAQLSALLGDNDAALASVHQAEALLDAIPLLLPLHSAFHFHAALSRLAADPGRLSPAWLPIARHLRSLRFHAASAPMNHAHRVRIVEGKMAAVRGRHGVALRAFEEGLDLARRHGYLAEEGIAAELAAHMLAAQNNLRAARPYADAAIDAFRRWEASAVVSVCERRMAQIFEQPSIPDAAGSARVFINTTAELEQLDLRSVMKASQTLSEEIVYSRLLAKMMALMLETSGATRGALVLLGPDGPHVEVALEVGQPSERARCHVPHIRSEALSFALSNYVLRTGRAVTLADALADPQHAQDGYYRRTRARSVLCAPICRGGEVIGAVHLENDLIAGCFNEHSLEIVTMLAAQAAISIENARLYEHLDSEVRRRTRELETARQLAESANDAKSSFLANMSHELRTPLNAILGYAEMLTEDLELMSGDEVRADLGRIGAAGTHLLELINEVLDLSKIEAGRFELVATPFSMGELIDEIVVMARPLLTQRNDQLTVLMTEHAGYLTTDRLRLKQAIFNLVSNAAKFTENGQVTLQIERFSRHAAEWIRIGVRDTGIGIDQAELHRLFKAFSQATPRTAHRYGGSGLGLSLSRRLCRLLGGDIHVQSMPAEGSCFTIEVPCILPVAPTDELSGVVAELT